MVVIVGFVLISYEIRRHYVEFSQLREQYRSVNEEKENRASYQTPTHENKSAKLEMGGVPPLAAGNDDAMTGPTTPE